jgi:predicted kinase
MSGAGAGARCRRGQLIVLRGNSGSGKTSTAMALRAWLGPGVALIQQDVLRRIVLREPDLPGGANLALISTTTRFALNHGYDVILEGIMSARRYGEMLSSLANDYGGAFYYFDVSLTETLRRHATRPQSAEFGADTMRGWYRHRDLLPDIEERIIDEKSCLDNTVERILHDVYPDGMRAAGRPSARSTTTC